MPEIFHFQLIDVLIVIFTHFVSMATVSANLDTMEQDILVTARNQLKVGYYYLNYSLSVAQLYAKQYRTNTGIQIPDMFCIF